MRCATIKNEKNTSKQKKVVIIIIKGLGHNVVYTFATWTLLFRFCKETNSPCVVAADTIFLKGALSNGTAAPFTTKK